MDRRTFLSVGVGVVGSLAGCSSHSPGSAPTDVTPVSIEGFAGAIEYRDTGWVDPYALVTALVDDARRSGARVATDVTVTGVLADSGAVRGVATTEGELQADRVVLAAGWRSRGLLAGHLEVPVRSFRTQVIVMQRHGSAR